MNQNKLEKYLAKPNPTLDNPPENRLIPVFLSDSKGRYLRYEAAVPLEHNIVWVDQGHEGGRTTRQGVEWVRQNVKNFPTRYPYGFVLFYLVCSILGYRRLVFLIIQLENCVQRPI